MGNSKNIIGTVVGVTNPREFYFSIAPGKAQLQEIVAVDAYELDESGEKKDKTVRVWAKVVEIERINPLFPQEVAQELSFQQMSAFDTVIPLSREMITAKCAVLGLENKKGELQPLTYPLQPASSVYIPSKKDVEKLVIGDIPDYRKLHIGHLRSKPEFKVFIDGHAIVARHLAVLAATGAGKTVTVRRIIEELSSRKYPILIFDPHGDYIGLKELPELKGSVEVYLPVFRVLEESFDNLILLLSGLSSEDITPPQETLIGGLLDLFNTKEGREFIDNYIRPISESRRTEYRLNIESHHFYAMNEVLDILERLQTEESWEEVRNELNTISRRLVRGMSTSIRPVSRILSRAALSYSQIKKINRFKRDFGVELPSPQDISSLISPGKISIINLEGYSNLSSVVASNILRQLLNLRVEEKVHRFLTVIEEAHNFIPSSIESAVQSSAISVIRQIATEGRKYGMGLILISQRPSRVDSTIVSQCNSFIVLKIINPGDQKYVRDVVESIGEEDAKILPDLATGEALITGECVRFPMLARIERPRSVGRHEEEDFIKEILDKESNVVSQKSKTKELPLLKKQ
jgi:hypothetical protein